MISITKKLGGRVVDSLDDTVTHIVTRSYENRCCKRTIKYCWGVLRRCWVLDFDWILKCNKTSSWVDEAPFEVAGDTHALGAPSRAREMVGTVGK